jgi:hypothetical protein
MPALTLAENPLWSTKFLRFRHVISGVQPVEARGAARSQSRFPRRMQGPRAACRPFSTDRQGSLRLPQVGFVYPVADGCGRHRRCKSSNPFFGFVPSCWHACPAVSPGPRPSFCRARHTLFRAVRRHRQSRHNRASATAGGRPSVVWRGCVRPRRVTGRSLPIARRLIDDDCHQGEPGRGVPEQGS